MFKYLSAPICCLVFCLFALPTWAQEVNFKNNTFIRCTPSSIADYRGAMFPIGVERGLTRNISISAEIHLPLFYLLTNNKTLQPGSSVVSDFKYRVELRQYLNKVEDGIIPFLGLEFTQRWQTYQINDSGYFYYSGHWYDRYHFNGAYVKRDFTTFAAVFGCRVPIIRKISTELDFGIGVKAFNIDYNADVTYIEYLKRPFLDLFEPARDNQHFEGSVTNLYSTVALRMSYQL